MTFAHPAHPVQQAWRQSDMMFLSSVRTASLKQLYAMQSVFIKLIGDSDEHPMAWKLVCVERRLDGDCR